MRCIHALLITILVAVPSWASAQDLATGTYQGNDTARTISGVGFQPDWVIIKSANSSGARRSVWRIGSHTGSDARQVNGAEANNTVTITGFTSDGFTLGTDSRVNEGSPAETYHWVAMQAGGDWIYSFYDGDNDTNRSITGVGFQPELVVIMPDGAAQPSWKSSSHPSTESNRFGVAGTMNTELLSLDSDGFTLGSGLSVVNQTGRRYYYLALVHQGRFSVTGNYAGNGSTQVILTTSGSDAIVPRFVWTKAGSQVNSFRTDTMTDPVSYEWRGNIISTNGITSLSATNAFTVGSSSNVNASGFTYHWVAFGDGSDPLAVKLKSFTAEQYPQGALIKWRTGYESRTLGFHLYRRMDGQVKRLTKSPIIGSGLTLGGAANIGQRYNFFDPEAKAGKAAPEYWLEEIELSGDRTQLRTIQTKLGAGDLAKHLQKSPTFLSYHPKVPGTKLPGSLAGISSEDAAMISNHNLVRALQGGNFVPDTALKPEAGVQPRKTHRVLTDAQKAFCAKGGVVPEAYQNQWRIAASADARKIAVTQAGWHQLSYEDLGLVTPLVSMRLKLYVDGTQAGLTINDGGDGSFDPGDTIAFYGEPLDNDVTTTRAYWLAVEDGQQTTVAKDTTQPSGTPEDSFIDVVRLLPRDLYVAGVRNGPLSNFFGLPILGEPVSYVLSTSDVVGHADEPALLGVELQGLSLGDHAVGVRINGVYLGQISFQGRRLQRAWFAVPTSALIDGDNTVTFASAGETDTNFLSKLELTYRRAAKLGSQQLALAGQGGSAMTLADATVDTLVFDVTDPKAPVRLSVSATQAGVDFMVPGQGVRQLLAVPAGVMLSTTAAVNQPSEWAKPQALGLLAIAHESLTTPAQRLIDYRKSQGWQGAVIDVEDLYDEFTFGNHDRHAVRCMLGNAYQNWPSYPGHVALFGTASIDPRNDLAQNRPDLVPTGNITADRLETASDDWHADFDGDMRAEIAIGRFAVSTPAQADAVIDKLIAYDATAVGDWSKRIWLASDVDPAGEVDFAAKQQQLADRFANRWQVAQSTPANGADVQAGFNTGHLIVDYYGHGSTEIWSGDLLDVADVSTMTNTIRPFVFNLTCLNGLFHGLYTKSLAQELVNAPHGGAIGALASSAMGNPTVHNVINRELLDRIAAGKTQTIGEAVLQMKRAMSRSERGSWILFGDPTLRLAESHAPFGSDGIDPRAGLVRQAVNVLPLEPVNPTVTVGDSPKTSASGCAIGDQPSLVLIGLLLAVALRRRSRAA